TSLADGAYELRAVSTGATDLTYLSGIHQATIDRTAPAVLGVPSPVDGIYHTGDNVAIVYTEAINCATWGSGATDLTVDVLPYGETTA
ncbi:MAG TPA: hypothetical protein DCE41_15010, partial [Cytophagales bacterium]|nr:hypothetical protein [Cytophagales bacterium]